VSRSAGIPLVDLFDLTDRVQSVLPQNIRDFVERFVVVAHRSSQSDNAVFHFRCTHLRGAALRPTCAGERRA
jgi:hypothetical protein